MRLLRSVTLQPIGQPSRTLNPAIEFLALVATGADVMAQNASGDTPLHAAAEINGATDVKNNILALLAAGADVMVQNKDGKIPWDYAKNNDDIDETDEYTALKKATCGWGYWFKNLFGLCG